MNCAESHELLHAHADDELDIVNGMELENHLKTCAICAAESRGVQSLKKALREPSLRYEAPDALRNEIHRMARPSGNDPGWFQSLLFWKSVAFGATAFALLALFIRSGVFAGDRLLDEAVAGHVRSLMAEHLTDVASSDQHTVKPWFNGKIDFAPNVKDFAAEGFPLVGGRLDYLEGHPVAALIYRHNKHLVNVFAWPVANSANKGPSVFHRRGYSIIRREAQGLYYLLVSDLNQKELAELASLLTP